MHPERRGAPRFPVQLEIAVNGGNAVTSNVSSAGVYFTTPLLLSPGQEVSIVVPFPHVAPGTAAACSARVLRVDVAAGRYAVAANYEAIRFDVTVSGATRQGARG